VSDTGTEFAFTPDDSNHDLYQRIVNTLSLRSRGWERKCATAAITGGRSAITRFWLAPTGTLQLRQAHVIGAAIMMMLAVGCRSR
jgi:hypothetical protein